MNSWLAAESLLANIVRNSDLLGNINNNIAYIFFNDSYYFIDDLQTLSNQSFGTRFPAKRGVLCSGGNEPIFSAVVRTVTFGTLELLKTRSITRMQDILSSAKRKWKMAMRCCKNVLIGPFMLCYNNPPNKISYFNIYINFIAIQFVSWSSNVVRI